MLVKRPQVFFGGKTALQIAREVGTGAVASKKSAVRRVPDRVPTRSEVDEAVACIEAAYPDLRIERPAHVLVGSAMRGRATDSFKAHTCSEQLSGGSFFSAGQGILVSVPALSFARLAIGSKDMIALLELGYEICGSYRTWRTSSTSAYQVEPIASVRALRDYVTRNPSIEGARKIARIVAYLADDSASPRETKQCLVFGMPQRYGGAGLGIPAMNFEVAATREAWVIAGRRSFRCDLCWPEFKLDVEYQSRENHEGEASRIKDSRRTNALIAMGWTVVNVTNDELDSLATTDAIARTLRRHMGKSSQIRVADYHARKLKLRRQLALPIGYE